MFKFKFKSSVDGNTYYSVLTHVCEWTWAEYFSSDLGGLDESDFTETDAERMVFKNWYEPANEFFYSKYDFPISLSRAVTDFEGIKDFYSTIMDANIIR